MAQVIDNKVTYGAGEALPTPGTPEYNQALSGVVPTAPSSGVIPLDKVTNSPAPLIVSPYTNETSTNAGSNISGVTDGLNQNIIDEQQQIADAAKTSVNQDTSVLKGYINKLMGKGDAQVTEEAAAGIPEKSQLLNSISNEYTLTSRKYDKQIEDIQKNAGGDLSSGVQVKVDQANRNKNSELADIAIRQSVAQNDLTTAQKLVDHKIDLQYGDLKDMISYQEKFLNDNQATLSDAQKSVLSLKIDQNQKEYEQKTSDARMLEDTKVKALSEAQTNGAPGSILKSIQAASSPEAAMAAAGTYIGKLDRVYKQQQINKILNPEGGNPNQVLSISDAKSLGVPYGTTRAEAIKLNKIPGGDAPDNLFSKTQLNEGAALANVPLDTFKNYSYQAQNLFVSRGPEISKNLSTMQKEITDGTSNVEDLKKTINDDATIPAEIKQFYSDKLDKMKTADTKSWWDSFTSIF